MSLSCLCTALLVAGYICCVQRFWLLDTYSEVSTTKSDNFSTNFSACCRVETL